MRYEQLGINQLDVLHCSLHGPRDLGKGEKWYQDPVNGSNGNSGKTANTALKTLVCGEAAMTAGQNDTLLVLPGKETVTASLAWDKESTHIAGLGGPLPHGGMDATSEVWYNCVTTAVASVIDVQANNCIFSGIHLRNVAADAGNLSALKVSTGVNFYAEDCHFNGQGATTQVATATACALWFYTAAGGKPWGATFRRCKIGDAGELVRTAGPVIYFSGGTALTAKYVKFYDCEVEGWCETAAIPAVLFGEDYCIDRYILFKDTLFYNYYVNNAATLTEVFKNSCGTTVNIVLQGSTVAVGYANWQSAVGLNYVYNAFPARADNGGIAVVSNTA